MILCWIIVTIFNILTAVNYAIMNFQNKTAFITGSSRGIGKAIALKLASLGANIVVVAKSVVENPALGGTIYSAAKEVEMAGGKALAIPCDIREEAQVVSAMNKAAEHFGGIDIIVNNASAISLTNTAATELKKFDLMQDINVRGTFLVSKCGIDHLKKSTNPHILTLSPPINMNLKWFEEHTAYTVSKYSMSMIAMGLSAELKPYGIASNTLWPKTTIATAAVKNLLGGDALMKMSRKPEIVADAAFHILSKKAAACTGYHFIDEEVLLTEGVTDFEQYAVVPGGRLFGDLFL
jgi:citronellol/citronellal dehydrogenase